MTKQLNKDLSILIASFDKAYDIWNITDFYFNKYWKDNPYKIYLGANGENKEKFCPEKWSYVNKGEDLSWSKSMYDYLNSIDTKYVLVYLDDFALNERVSTNEINNIITFMNDDNSKMVRLSSRPKPDMKINSKIGRISINDRVPYSTSLQAAIWDRNFLIDLLKYNFNPWEFETKAGKTIEAFNNSDKFYATYDSILKYKHFVEKGKFLSFIKENAKDDNISLNANNRSFWDKSDMNTTLMSIVYSYVPNKYKNKIRKLLKKEEL